MLGSLILYLKILRIMMFQLSGFYCKALKSEASQPPPSEPSEPPRSLSPKLSWEFPEIGENPKKYPK